jgi:hypothetical protein
LSQEIESISQSIALDLDEGTSVDLDIVQLLVRCEAKGIELMHCPPYIREWITRERNRAASRDEE